MTERRLKKLFPNPFYVVLLISSTLFVVTALAWLVVPSMLDQAPAPPQAERGMVGLARWVDRNGTVALGGEVAVMLAAALLAMLTDRWFPERPAPRA